jgi:hypothetical protein
VSNGTIAVFLAIELISFAYFAAWLLEFVLPKKPASVD